MKARFLMLAGAALLLVNGCMNANSETEPLSTNAVVPPAPTEPAVMATSSNTAPIAAKPSAENAAGPAAEPVNAIATPPATVKLSPSAGEITKLVQAGVDSNVIMAYVTNSPNTFRLEADDIVYLKDLGMSPDVVTAMIQHDQSVKAAATAGVPVSPISNAPQPASLWAAGAIAPTNSVWAENEPAPAVQPSTSTTVPPPPTAEVPAPETVNYFYDSLSPYGTWVDVEGYGRCWRPTVVVTTPGWRPYSHSGRWEWTDSGWYWYSDYSWGWAPFHYGRWFSHPRWGWCWVPGSTWGPSWVSWRYSDDYCGWSPLPPAAYYAPSVGFTYFGRSCGSSFSFGLTWDCFTFVSYNNFHNHRYDRDCVPHHQAGGVYNHTTVVNNIIRGNNNTIINQGIAPTQITSHGGAPIKEVTIRDSHGPRGGQVIRHEELAHDGHINTIRPTVPTGHGHTTVSVGEGPARGGAQGLNTGNAAAAPSAPQVGLNPPRVIGSGPHHSAPPTMSGGSPAATPTPPATAQSPTPASPTVPGTGGIRPSAPVKGSVWSTPATPNTPSDASHGGLVIRNPRTTRGANANTVAPGNGLTQPSVTPSHPTQPTAPNAPATAATPGPARTTRTPQATPWLNNPSTPANAGVKSPQLAEESTPTRPWSGTRDVRSGGTWNNGNNNNPPASTPNNVAPTIRSAPTYQAPSAPSRVFGAPAASPPSQSYTPPTRSAPERYTPPSQPSYSAPTRDASPSRSYTPPAYTPPTRSESHSSPPPPPSSGGSSRGSDSSRSSSSSSKDDRSSSSRGR